jgi:hypothetical protein
LQTKGGRWSDCVGLQYKIDINASRGGSIHPPLLAVIYKEDTAEPNYFLLLTVKGMVTSCMMDCPGQPGHALSNEYINGLITLRPRLA